MSVTEDTSMVPGDPWLEWDPDLSRSVEGFLYHDAALLDARRFEEWLDLFALDCRYLVPATDRPGGDPLTEMFLVNDDRFLLEERVAGIVKGTAWAESPPSTTHRIVGNVRAASTGDGLVRAEANFLIHRSSSRSILSYPGRYELVLVAGGPAGFVFQVRKATLAMETLRPHGRVSIIL
ncbi:MAG TPA: aromatic-ring-hydroxylating dioxygenase subunit beta [Acidimicrobiales bacterium]|nr:aromatic-ring-hydroxylating dioxygenase subunit beta [Acidimicrobiales bacterium]